MALRLELWARGRIIDGAEIWWDDVELALSGDAGEALPTLRRVDPYGDTLFGVSELDELAREARQLRVQASASARPLLDRLVDLCSTGMSEADAQLRIVGD